MAEPPNAKQPAAPEASDSKAGNSTPGKSTPSNASAAEPPPTSGSAPLDTAPVQALSSDATAAAEPTAKAAETGPPIADSPTNNTAPSIPNNTASNKAQSLTPNLTPSANAPAPTPAPIVVTTIDAPSNGKIGASTQPTFAAPSQATTTAAAPTESAPETGFAIANNLTSNFTNNVANNNVPFLAPNLTPNSSVRAPIAATTIAGPSNGKTSVPGQPAPAAPSQTTTTAAPAASAPETGFAIADSLTHDITDTPNNNAPSLIPNLTSNSSSAAPTPASIAATMNDAPSNGKPGVSAQPASAAALLTTAADKKSSAAVQPNATPSSATPSHDASAAVAPGSDPSATLTAPAPPASAPPSQVRSDAAPELPKTHQMLDSAPPAPPTAPAAPSAPTPAADAQMNVQMHLGVRTDAFGAVEIHTVVQQSQVGITVHADRDIARWFSSEVPGLESGLNKSHLNLTAVGFDNGGSGVQTATSFQHGQPRQSFSPTPGSQTAALLDSLSEKDTASESATVDILPSDVSVGPVTHVSIHV